MAFQTARPGFDFVASYTGQGEYYGCTFLVNGVPVKATNWVDDVATDYALDFIRTNRTRPWRMMLGFKSPRTPRRPPERAWRAGPSSQINLYGLSTVGGLCHGRDGGQMWQ